MTNTLVLGKSTTNTSLEGFGVDDDEVLYIVRDGTLVSVNNLQEETIVPGAPDGIDGDGASDGQLWTADGAGGAGFVKPVSFLLALTYQEGTAAPELTITTNNIAPIVAITRNGVGHYRINFGEGFDTTLYGWFTPDSPAVLSAVYQNVNKEVWIYTTTVAGAPSDDLLSGSIVICTSPV